MGLIELLQQGQTILSAGSFPGDTPINDPQSGFIQSTSPTNTYSDGTVGQPDNGSTLATTLNNTALDNTNNSSTTSTGVPSPNTYFPVNAKGRYGLAPYVFNPNYNPSYTYLSLAGPNFTWHNNTELEQTSLDNTDSNKISATPIPNDLTYPNYYPAMEDVNLGSFNGAPSTDPTYSTPYNTNNTYLNSVPIQDPNSPQLPTLGETGLDLEDATYAPTAIVPNSTSYPNNYPALSGVNLAGIGAPKQYSTNWRQNNNYLNNFGSSLHSSLFGISNLDNASSTTSSPLIANQIDVNNNFNIIFASSLTGAGTSIASNTPPPVTSTSPTNYPALQHVYLGEFNGAPSQYNTIYNADRTYLQNYNTITNPTTNPQTNTLDETGLDVENSDALPTSLLFAPTNPDDITVYPAENVTSNSTGGAPHRFEQLWRPAKRYYNDYIKSLKDRNLV